MCESASANDQHTVLNLQLFKKSRENDKKKKNEKKKKKKLTKSFGIVFLFCQFDEILRNCSKDFTKVCLLPVQILILPMDPWPMSKWLTSDEAVRKAQCGNYRNLLLFCQKIREINFISK